LISYAEPSPVTGKSDYRWHCGRCGCPIVGSDAENPGVLYLRAGFFVREVQSPPQSELVPWQKVEWLKGKLEGLEEDVTMEGWHPKFQGQEQS